MLVSEITPRQLTKDDEVLKCNKELKEILKDEQEVTIVRHSNLRNNEWSFHIEGDDKHFTAPAIARLAGNLKAAFRKALGIERNAPWKNSKDNNGGKGRANNSGNIRNIIRNELSKALRSQSSNSSFNI